MANPHEVAIPETLHQDATELAQRLFSPPEYKLLLPPAHGWHDEADAVVMRTGSLTRQYIDAAKKLKVVGKQGAGLDEVDLDAAKERGISVRNTPGVNATAVSELVIAHIFAIARQLGDITVRQRNGVICMGAIGKSVAGMLHHGSACKIYAYDPYVPKDAWTEFPYARVENVKDMLPVVDVLILHVPLLETTKKLIRITELRAMKENCILINHSRGGIVNEDDLVVAWKEGRIRGVGIDALVYDPPTLDKYGELWSLPNVVNTPHVGATIPQTQSETACAAVNKVWEFFQDQATQLV